MICYGKLQPCLQMLIMLCHDMYSILEQMFRIVFFSSNGYFTVGADIAYDFLGFTIANGESKSEGTHDFIFNPKIDVGFRFK